MASGVVSTAIVCVWGQGINRAFLPRWSCCPYNSECAIVIDGCFARVASRVTAYHSLICCWRSLWLCRHLRGWAACTSYVWWPIHRLIGKNYSKTICNIITFFDSIRMHCVTALALKSPVVWLAAQDAEMSVQR